jgi:hypothetical protein
MLIFFQANNKRKRASQNKPSKKSKNADIESTPSNEVSKETKAKLGIFPSDEVNLTLLTLHAFITTHTVCFFGTCQFLPSSPSPFFYYYVWSVKNYISHL